jgi:hypothetical protein
MPKQAIPTRQPVTASLKRFSDFDAAAEAEARAPAPSDFTESLRRLGKLIDKLPQREAIKPEHAKNWMERTLRNAVKRMELEHGEGNATVAQVHEHVLWHVRRASGIGGSEAGTVLKHYRGKKGTFGDAHKLVQEKLLILSPQPSNEVMARGVRAEPWIQKIAHDSMATRTDEVALKKLRGFRPTAHPAAVGTPDDITVPAAVENPDPDDRSIDDYKAPSALVMEEYDKDGVSFDYVCQLHHYGYISREAGVAFTRMAIKALDPRSFTIEVFPVPFDEDLSTELTTAIDRIWNEHVMLGVVPDAPKPDELPVEDEALLKIGAEAALMKIFSDDAKTRFDDLRKRISTVSEDWHDVATGNMDLKLGAYSRKRSWKEEELLSLAEQAGVETDEFYKKNMKKLDTDRALKLISALSKAIEEEGDIDQALDKLVQDLPFERKLDADALASRLEEMDISLVTAMSVSEGFRLTTKKKGPEIDRLNAARGEVSRLMDALEGVMGDAVDMVLAADEAEEPSDQPEPDYV